MGTQSISSIISQHAAERPHDPALTCGDTTLSWQELDRRTNRLARAYADLGVAPDDLVTIALPNSTEFMEAAIAVWKLGATPQPVSAKLPGRELTEIVQLADSSLVVGADPGRVPDHRSIPVGWRPDPSISDEPLPDRTATHFKAPTSGGSTGRPKIILAQNPGAFEIGAVGLSIPLRDTCIVPGVLYHNAPFTSTTLGLVNGNHVVNFPRFDGEAVLRAPGQAYLCLRPLGFASGPCSQARGRGGAHPMSTAATREAAVARVGRSVWSMRGSSAGSKWPMRRPAKPFTQRV